jgi:hypothetical protein
MYFEFVFMNWINLGVCETFTLKNHPYFCFIRNHYNASVNFGIHVLHSHGEVSIILLME